MENTIGPKLIPSSGRVAKHGEKWARSSFGPGGRFIFEGEYKNPETDTRKTLVTVKDLKNLKIEGDFIYIYLLLMYLILSWFSLKSAILADIGELRGKYIISTHLQYICNKFNRYCK